MAFTKNVLDFVACGIGPFNISLGCLLSSFPTLQGAFFDRNSHFSWHPNFMLDDARLQVHWVKDCVSAIDPTNKFSFLNFIVKQGLFYQFFARKNAAITRQEYNSYLEWIIPQLDNFYFNSEVTQVTLNNKNIFETIINNKDKLLAKNIILGSGPQQAIPEFAQKYVGISVFHSSNYLLHKKSLVNKTVLVVGNGQSACEIMTDLFKEKSVIPQNIIWVSASSAFHALDDNALINTLYSPNSANRFYDTVTSYKPKLFERLLHTSDGISLDTANDLFELFYLNRIYKKQAVSISLDTLLTAIKPLNESFAVDLHFKKMAQCRTLHVDKIILATGYKQKLPKFLTEIEHIIAFDKDKQPIIKNDYSLELNIETPAKIFTQNLARHMVGPIDSNLSIMPWRNAKIINTMIGKSVYDIDKNDIPTFNDLYDELESWCHYQLVGLP